MHKLEKKEDLHREGWICGARVFWETVLHHFTRVDTRHYAAWTVMYVASALEFITTYRTNSSVVATVPHQCEQWESRRRSRGGKYGSVTWPRPGSEPRFRCSPLKNQSSRDTDGGKGRVALFGDLATWADGGLIDHLPCPGGAGGLSRGRHGEREGGCGQEKPVASLLSTTPNRLAGIMATVFECGQALCPGIVWSFSPRDQGSANLRASPFCSRPRDLCQQARSAEAGGKLSLQTVGALVQELCSFSKPKTAVRNKAF